MRVLREGMEVEYNQIVHFFGKILNQMHLSCQILSAEEFSVESVDLGLRSALGIRIESVEEWAVHLKNTIRENSVYYIIDEFQCRYAALILPGEQPRKIMVIGPYTPEDTDRNWVTEFVRRSGLGETWIPVLEQHFRKIRFLESEHLLFAALQALGEQLWGAGQFSTERILRGIPERWVPMEPPEENRGSENLLQGIALIEERYAAENRLMEAVSKGRSPQAQMMLSGFPRSAMERRGDPVRDVRNYSVILNTLMRKAAEQGGVHPLYIDQLSSGFAKAIEQTREWEGFLELWKEMALRYCLMVKKHNMSGYSPLVQKVITRVDFDLSADLSLGTVAKDLSVNASYLSSVFRKETGYSYIDYVNRKRMEHAAYLLSDSRQLISSIAQSCGIQDDNYFTKLFKKYNGKTPRQFRQEQGLSARK